MLRPCYFIRCQWGITQEVTEEAVSGTEPSNAADDPVALRMIPNDTDIRVERITCWGLQEGRQKAEGQAVS